MKKETRVVPVTNMTPFHAMDGARLSNRDDAPEIETNTQDVGR